jgi:hypothetical protein
VFRWKLYSRQRESCWLERHADWDRCCREIGANCLRDVGYASDHDRAIGARDIGVEMRTIGRVASLGLVVLLWWSDHDEAAFGFVEVVIGIQVKSRLWENCWSCRGLGWVAIGVEDGIEGDSTMTMSLIRSRTLFVKVNFGDRIDVEGRRTRPEQIIPQEHQQRHRDSDRRNNNTHCNTSKLHPPLNDRIPKVFTIVFILLWLLFDDDISAGPAHLATILVFRIPEGR